MGAVTHGDVLAGVASPEELVPFGGEQAHKAFALAVGLELLVRRARRATSTAQSSSSRGPSTTPSRFCAGSQPAAGFRATSSDDGVKGPARRAATASRLSTTSRVIASRAWRVALPRCGVRTTFSSPTSSAGTFGSSTKTSRPGADTAGDELRDERLLVDDLAARGVDEAGAVPQQPEPPRVEQAARLGRQRDVQRHEVRLREQRVELAVLAEVGLDRAPPRVEHAQVEAASASRDGAPDAAEADDAERRAGHLLRDTSFRPRPGPAAGADEAVALDDLPARREDEREREIGDAWSRGRRACSSRATPRSRQASTPTRS